MADPFIGEIKLVAFNFAPRGWAFCNGQLLPISQNQALFSLLGTIYGGDGRTTFALPNLQGRVPIHLSSTHPQGQSFGEETHTLSTPEMPQHSHALAALKADASQESPVGNLPAYSAEEAYSREGVPVAMLPDAIGTAGGGQAHQNMQPYLVLNFAIALVGIFPSRS